MKREEKFAKLTGIIHDVSMLQDATRGESAYWKMTLDAILYLLSALRSTLGAKAGLRANLDNLGKQRKP